MQNNVSIWVDAVNWETAMHSEAERSGLIGNFQIFTVLGATSADSNVNEIVNKMDGNRRL